jgi:drug/metabolite transporter (DMT)-like permease
VSVSAGIALRLAATGLFSLMSLFVRLATFEAPVGQIMFWRSSVALLPILGYMAWRGHLRGVARTRNLRGHFLRSLSGAGSMWFSFLCLAKLPIALATALSFLGPLVAVPAAALWLRERPGWAVSAAAVIGFCGVGVMLWPAFQGPRLDVGTTIGVAAGLAGACTTVLAKIQTKTLTATETTGSIAFYFAVFCTLAGLATWPFGWVAASGWTLVWLISSGLVGGLAHICLTEAMARAPISTLAPFEYTAMVWALGLDLLVFQLLPNPFSLVGAATIVAAAAMVAFADRGASAADGRGRRSR